MRTLEHLSFSHFIKHPKWFIGYSDITVFHSAINNLGIETIHAPMPFSFGKPDFDIETFNELIFLLQGSTLKYCFKGHPLNSQGKAKGRLVGGNLSVLYSLRGTHYDLQPHGKILFIEDIDEYLYHIDRMIINFRLGGIFGHLRAIIVGDMTDMKDNNTPYGKNAYEIVAEHAKEVGIPTCFGFPSGHGKINKPLILGREVIIDVSQNCILTFK